VEDGRDKGAMANGHQSSPSAAVDEAALDLIAARLERSVNERLDARFGAWSSVIEERVAGRIDAHLSTDLDAYALGRGASSSRGHVQMWVAIASLAFGVPMVAEGCRGASWASSPCS
jgi:hypothetical protein